MNLNLYITTKPNDTNKQLLMFIDTNIKKINQTGYFIKFIIAKTTDSKMLENAGISLFPTLVLVQNKQTKITGYTEIRKIITQLVQAKQQKPDQSGIIINPNMSDDEIFENYKNQALLTVKRNTMGQVVPETDEAEDTGKTLQDKHRQALQARKTTSKHFGANGPDQQQQDTQPQPQQQPQRRTQNITVIDNENYENKPITLPKRAGGGGGGSDDDLLNQFLVNQGITTE